jgi:hypothetical protein
LPILRRVIWKKKLKTNFPKQLIIKSEDDEYENPFMPFIGMFSSGETDASTRYKEILRKEIDNRGGFRGS